MESQWPQPHDKDAETWLAPPWMPEGARRIWDAVLSTAIARQPFRASDTFALACFCVMMHEWVVLTEAMRDARTPGKVRLIERQKRQNYGTVSRPRAEAQVCERRARFGALIQIDGSVHAWLEDRGPKLTLIVFIDDATGRLTALRFAPSETTPAYAETLRDHVLAHGLPLAFYSH
jgi:hypothetical protein